MARVTEKLVELYEITERRDGAVFKTRYVEDKWVALDEEPPEGFQFVPLSTEREKAKIYKGEHTLRSRTVEEPDPSPYDPRPDPRTHPEFWTE